MTAYAKMIDADTAERIGHRLAAQEIRRQNNIDSVVEATAEELRGKEVSEETIDVDWATRFFGIVQDVSDEEMKALWAKILAREIEKPRSFSVRTLNLVSMLSRSEAEVIGKMAQFVMYDMNERDAYILNSKTIEEVKFDEVMLLMELGLLDNSSNLAITLEKNDADVNNLLLVKSGIGLFISTEQKQLFVHVYKFTNLGREVLQLADGAELNVKYVKEYSENLIKGDKTMKVTCAPILKLVDNDVDLDEEKAFFKIGASNVISRNQVNN